MKKSKILISAVTMFSLCITPMSVAYPFEGKIY